MDKRKIKKLLILNLPYFLVGLFATNLGEAWRLAEGADSSAKILSFFHALPIALNNPFPSFHPLDLLIGISIEIHFNLKPLPEVEQVTA